MAERVDEQPSAPAPYVWRPPPWAIWLNVAGTILWVLVVRVHASAGNALLAALTAVVVVMSLLRTASVTRSLIRVDRDGISWSHGLRRHHARWRDVEALEWRHSRWRHSGYLVRTRTAPKPMRLPSWGSRPDELMGRALRRWCRHAGARVALADVGPANDPDRTLP